MSKKKKVTLIVCMFIAMVITTTLMILWSIPSAESDEDILTPVVSADDDSENLELSFTGQSTGPEEDPFMEPYLRVYLTNPNDLYTSELPRDGYGLLEGFLNQYINYYLPGDKVYAVEYKKNSVSYNQIATKFKVTIPELDLEIRCIYIPTEKEYLFRSDLDSQSEIYEINVSGNQTTTNVPTVSGASTVSDSH